MAAALNAEQRAQLDMFREVTANARDEASSIQLMQSCGWNVEQALQLHWATDDMQTPAPAADVQASGSGLGAPLLAPAAGGGSSGSPTAAAMRGGTSLLQSGRFALLSRVGRIVRRIGVSVFSIICTFIFGPGGPRLGGGHASGAAFSRALTTQYSAPGNQLQFPQFFEGSFSQALQAARRDLKLLVVYLHSENARYTQAFCTTVLNHALIRSMLDESFVLWGGDIARMESHQVSQMIRARSYPCFCVLLPASVDDVRVIGVVTGEVQVDQVVALLTACLEEMESHRAEIVARREQQSEDRALREAQDREYQEAVEADRRREEERRREVRAREEAERAAAEERNKAEEEARKLEAERQRLQEKRREQAISLEAEGGSATARVALRLPAGQRIQRKFRPDATLADVYAWAGCAAYLPENEGKGLEIPARFILKTSFPSRELTEMERTIKDLELAGTNILLAEVEDDD